MRYGLFLSFFTLVCFSPAWALTAEQEAKLLASDGAPYDLFGESVALDGDTAIIGAWRDDDNGWDSGSAYVFRLIPDEDVPATTVVGLALLLLAVLGTGVYFMPRRATGWQPASSAEPRSPA